MSATPKGGGIQLYRPRGFQTAQGFQRKLEKLVYHVKASDILNVDSTSFKNNMGLTKPFCGIQPSC